MARTAVLVCEEVQTQESRLLEVLKFFGVNWQRVGPDALRNPSADLLANGEYSVFCSMSLLGAAIDASTETGLPSLLGAARSVYLFGGGDSQAFGHLLRWLTGSSSAEFRCSTERSELLCSISGASDVCGPMRNLQVRATATPVSWTMQVTSPGREFTSLIAADAGSLFAKVTIQGVPLFLDPNPDFIDISGPVQNGFFDVRDHFCAAVPIVMYLQSEFGHGLGYLNENGACLIVDDPVLRPQYGFVNFQQLSVLVANVTSAVP